MATVTVWVLVLYLHQGTNWAQNVVIDNIATREDCVELAGQLIPDNGTGNPVASSSIDAKCLPVRKVKP